MINAKKYIAKIVDSNKLTDNIYQIVLEMEGGENFSFESGQYILIEREFEGKKLKRAYSLSSTNFDLPKVELTIRRYDDGRMSKYLTNLQDGEAIEFTGPFGVFNWLKITQKNVVLVAIGCGIAPLKSIIDYLSQNVVEDRNVYLFFGNRFEKDIAYFEWFSELQRKWPKFFFFPCVSRPENKPGSIYTGRVNEVLTREYRKFSESDFFLCGSKEMLADTMDAIIGSGGSAEKIFFENILI